MSSTRGIIPLVTHAVIGAFCFLPANAVAIETTEYFSVGQYALHNRTHVPAACVTATASYGGRFSMSVKNGKPCKKCGGSAWHKNGRCAQCDRERCGKWRNNNLEKARAICKRYQANNPEAHRERSRRYYDGNIEKMREKSRGYTKANPEKRSAGVQRRRAKRKAAGGSYTAAEWEAIKKAQDYTCLCCGRREPEIKLTVDHVVPIDKRGRNDASNLQGLCRKCNGKKFTKVIDYRSGLGILRWVQNKLFD